MEKRENLYVITKIFYSKITAQNCNNKRIQRSSLGFRPLSTNLRQKKKTSST